VATDQPERTDEFVEHVTRNQGQLYGYVYALVQNAADADDLVQKTVLTLWKRFDDFEQGTDFAGWAWQTARYEVLNFLKARRRNRVFISDDLAETLADRAAINGVDELELARREALAGCVGELPESDQQMLHLRYENDCKVKEVASQLNRSSQSVCNSLERIRKVVFHCIERRLAREDLP
jgi:RNA polymerase sigma-70 factor (ECF subfamily)